MFDVQNKVALVTGGGSGIGLATAKQLLHNGARGVVLADIDTSAGNNALKEINKQYGQGKAIFVRTDVADKGSYEDAFIKTVEEFKNIDILVNNAGILREQIYEDVIATNLLGATHGIFLALNNYIRKYKYGSEGVIINTASVAGISSFPFSPIYGATKSGIISMTFAFGHSHHYLNTKIKVIAVAPGLTQTNIFNKIKEHGDPLMEFIETVSSQKIMQSAEFVAENIIKIIQEKPSGSVWIVTDNLEPIEFEQPTIPSVIQHKADEFFNMSDNN